MSAQQLASRTIKVGSEPDIPSDLRNPDHLDAQPPHPHGVVIDDRFAEVVRRVADGGRPPAEVVA